MEGIRHGKMATAVLIILGASTALAQADASNLELISVDELKRGYLDCDRTATQQLMAPASAVVCSHVGEALKKRVFDGDFDRLLAWWRTEKQRATSALESPSQSKGAPQ